jgi:hypothetical protein
VGRDQPAALGLGLSRARSGLGQVDAVVMADGGRVVAAERVQDADRVGFIGQVGDLGAADPAEGGDLLRDRKVPR